MLSGKRRLACDFWSRDVNSVWGFVTNVFVGNMAVKECIRGFYLLVALICDQGSVFLGYRQARNQIVLGYKCIV